MSKIKMFFQRIYRAYVSELRLVLHDQGLILFITFLPLIYPIIYSLIYNPELVKEVPMVVVDHDRSELSRELVRNMDACQEVWVTGYAADMSEARHAMDNHDCFAILEIPEGFGRSIGRNEVGNAAMYCDMSLLLRYRGFLMAATNVMTEMSSELQTRDINRTAPLSETIAVVDPLPISYRPMGNIRSGFDSFIMPGVLILILHQCIVLAMGMSGGAWRENKRLRNSCVSGKPGFVSGTMIGQMLCFYTLLCVPIIFMIHYVPLIFRFPMAGNLVEEFVFLLPMTLACFGLGYVYQAFVTERESVFVSWVVTSVVLLLLSGLIWPLQEMPAGWRALSSICPSTWGVEGYVKMNSNGASISQVSHEFNMLWILAAFWLTCGYCVQRWYVLPSIYGKNRKRVGDDPAQKDTVLSDQGNR